MALTGGVEEASLLQTWLFELMHPGYSARNLISLDPELLPPMDCGTDCNDLYEVLVKPAAPAPTNKALTLYLGALRSDKETKRILSWLWFDTTDMLANGMSKIEQDGTLSWQDLRAVLVRGWWQPTKLWKWNSLNMKPGASLASRSSDTAQAQGSVVHYSIGGDHYSEWEEDDEDEDWWTS